MVTIRTIGLGKIHGPHLEISGDLWYMGVALKSLIFPNSQWQFDQEFIALGKTQAATKSENLSR